MPILKCKHFSVVHEINSIRLFFFFLLSRSQYMSHGLQLVYAFEVLFSSEEGSDLAEAIVYHCLLGEKIESLLHASSCEC